MVGHRRSARDVGNENLQAKTNRVGQEGRDCRGNRGAACRDLAVRDVTFVKGGKQPPKRKPRPPDRKLTASEIEQARRDLDRVIKHKDLYVEIPDPRVLKHE